MESLIPVSMFAETMQYVSNQLRALSLSPDAFLLDWSCISSYTVPYMMYDSEVSSWRFNAEDSLSYVLQMIQAYGKG